MRRAINIGGRCSMSLWSKPLSQVAFEDVDDFCRSMQAEGVRLEYKGIEIPSDLSKVICAFANTLGGLIVLGVVADKTTNLPIWPPQEGLPQAPGLSERVAQLAHEAVYPPVAVDVSDTISNQLLPGHVILIVRVPESRLAPHAVEGNRKVYIYERTASRNRPYALADIGHIERLLARRQRFTDERDKWLEDNLAESP